MAGAGNTGEKQVRMAESRAQAALTLQRKKQRDAQLRAQMPMSAVIRRHLEGKPSSSED